LKPAHVLLVCIAMVAWSECSDEVPQSESGMPPLPVAAGSAASTTPRATDRFPTAKGDLVVTPLEHASVLFGWDGKAVYVDPTSPAIADAELPGADLVFVTEARFDHLDATAVKRLGRPGTVVVAPPGVADRIHVDVILKNGDTRTVLGVVATAVPLYSISRGPAPGLLYHDKGRGNGYVLDFGGTRVYLSGDTECTAETKALQRIDVAFVAVNPPTSMTPAEAVQCIDAFQPRVVLPYRDRHADLSELERAAAARGVDLRERNFYPRPEKWRTEAFEGCEKKRWGLCRDLLDRAAALDPLSETDPRVVRAREQVSVWRSPFPAWW